VLSIYLLLVLFPIASSGPQRDNPFATHVVQPEVRPARSESQNATAPPQDLEPLKAGDSIKGEIKGGETRSFNISLALDQFMAVMVKHQGIIVTVTLVTPDSKSVVAVDNPSGGHGRILLSAIATAAGPYRIEVRSTEDWANSGQYEVTIQELRLTKPEDQDRIAAERSFTEGRQHFDKDEKQEYEKAKSSFDASLSRWQLIHDNHWEALTQYVLGVTHRKLGERPEAEECFLEALKLQLDEDDWRLRAATLNDLGFTYAILGKKDAALDYLGQALGAFDAHQDNRGRASALQNIAITHQRAGEMELASKFYEDALPLRQVLHDKNGELNIRNNLAGISDRLGEPYEALAQYTRALEGWQELDRAGKLRESKQLGIGYNNVAVANDRLNAWQSAFDNYDKAYAVFERIGDAASQAATLDNIGELHTALGDPERGLGYYEQALRLIEKVKDPDETANILTHIGQAHILQGRLSEAFSDFQTALKLTPRPSASKLANVYANLGAVYALQRRNSEALASYEIALPLWRSSGDRRGEAATLQKRGEAYIGIGEQAKATQDFKVALATWRALADQRGEAAALNGIATVEQKLNHLSEALTRSEQAINISESLRTRVSSQRLRASYFATQQGYYEVNIDLKMKLYQAESSQEYLQSAFDASERSRARSLIDSLDDSHDEVTRGVSSDLLRLRREVKQRLSAKEQAQAKSLNGKPTKEEAESFKNELDKLIGEYDDIDAQIRGNSPNYAQLIKPQPFKVSEIQRQLDEGTLLLEYALGEKRSYVWVVSPDSIKGVELAGRAEIEKEARRVTDAVTARNREEKNEGFPQRLLRLDKAEKEYTEASAALSKVVLEPIASLLGQKRLVIVADGALQLVPFAALPAPATSTTPENSKPKANSSSAAAGPTLLIADHELVTLPSASVLALQRRELANRKPAPYAVALLADPVFDDQDIRVARATGIGNQHRKETATTGHGGAVTPAAGEKSTTSRSSNADSVLSSALRDVGLDPDGKLPRLALSREEARAIARAVSPSQSLSALDFKASRKTATSPELAKYRIIHFATHGVLDLDHPELSGIVLSMVDEKGRPQDGYLRLHEIYNLNLPAELVVLSACQTGVGKQIKGEGLIALTRGFMYAGAKSVVASLWKVDDAATSELMAEFYKQMFTNKLKPAAALRAAQVKMSQLKRWHEPYYWAGFFIQGEWN
jgi:CHAT domain-containing protein/predicted negative regulator of RcsB-dependent stress response